MIVSIKEAEANYWVKGKRWNFQGPRKKRRDTKRKNLDQALEQVGSCRHVLGLPGFIAWGGGWQARQRELADKLIRLGQEILHPAIELSVCLVLK